MLYYGWFAEVYRWPPEVVDRLPHWYEQDIQTFHAMVEDVKREQAEASDKAR